LLQLIEWQQIPGHHALPVPANRTAGTRFALLGIDAGGATRRVRGPG
jgi:hypothetical protein